MADTPVNGTAADDIIQQVDVDSFDVSQVSLNQCFWSFVTTAFRNVQFGVNVGGFGVRLGEKCDPRSSVCSNPSVQLLPVLFATSVNGTWARRDTGSLSLSRVLCVVCNAVAQ